MSTGDRSDFQRIRSPLEGSLVRLRAIEDDDLPAINQGIWDPDVSRSLALAWPESVAETRAWWERTRAREDVVVFAVETRDEELVGVLSIGIDDGPRSGTLGIWIARPRWDAGYGTDAVRTACRFAFGELNLQRMGLAVHDDNARGIRAYEKVGFREEGRVRRGHFTGGRFGDVIWMGLLAEELAGA
jgi:RimJ/RimL family protein N-acetyltransferase